MPESVISDIGRYAMVPEWLLDLDISAQSIRLYAVLAAKYADRDTGEAYPSRSRLADDLHASTDTIDRALRELVAHCAVTIEKRSTERGEWESNLYTIRFVRPPSRNDAATPSRTGEETPSRKDAARSISQIDPESSDPDKSKKRSAKRPRVTEVDEPFIEEMVSKYSLIKADRVRDEIASALGHDASLRYHDLKAYVRGWLSRTNWNAPQTRYAGKNGASPTYSGVNGRDDVWAGLINRGE